MAHVFGTASTRTSSTGNPIVTAAFTIDKLDTVLALSLKVNGATDRAGGAPTFGGYTMVQANATQKAASSPEAGCELWYLTAKQCGGRNLPIGTAFTCTIPNTGGLTVFYTLATGRAKAGGQSAIDVAGGANGTSANPAPGSLTTTEDGDIGFAVCASGLTNFDPATPAGTGFGTGTGTPLGTFDDGAHGGGQQYHLQSAKGAFDLGWTVGSDDWGAVAAYFKEVPPHAFNNYFGFQAGSGISVTEKIR